MATIKDLKKRIGTVKNTQQTTRAMKMVSAAKLRRSQEAIQSQRPYAKRIGELIQVLANLPNVTISSPLVGREEDSESSTRGKRVALVLMTSDRGLCGAFNGNIIKTAQRWVAANKSNYDHIELSFVGRRGYDFFKTKSVNLGHYDPELGGKVTFAKAKKLAEVLQEKYLSGQFDEVKVIYNEFKNAVTQKVNVEDFLPLKKPTGTSSDETPTAVPYYLVKPSPTEVLETLISKHFAIHAFRMLLDSQASEHGARMSAMENATKNAGEMIRKLTLQYNKQRQAGITKELLEIISGSESQKAS